MTGIKKQLRYLFIGMLVLGGITIVSTIIGTAIALLLLSGPIGVTVLGILSVIILMYCLGYIFNKIL